MLSCWLWRNRLWHCGEGHMEEPPSNLKDMQMVLGQQLARKWEPSSKGHKSMNSVNNVKESESGSFSNQVSKWYLDFSLVKPEQRTQLKCWPRLFQNVKITQVGTQSWSQEGRTQNSPIHHWLQITTFLAAATYIPRGPLTTLGSGPPKSFFFFFKLSFPFDSLLMLQPRLVYLFPVPRAPHRGDKAWSSWLLGRQYSLRSIIRRNWILLSIITHMSRKWSSPTGRLQTGTQPANTLILA